MALTSYRLEISTFAILEVGLYQAMVLNQYLTGVGMQMAVMQFQTSLRT